MASQKGVAFRVNDTSLATEFGPIASLTMADEESGLDIVPPDESLSAQRSLVLYMDIYRIEQVIRNLITNAIKFTPRDGEVSVGISFKTVSPTTTITTIKDKFGPDAVGYLRVEIVDSGVGLSEDEQRNVFQEFTQFNKNELQGGGSGLELELESIEQCDTPRPLRLLIVDDSSLNVKVVVRLIESEKAGPFANATLLTADDGATAVEQLRTEMAAGRAVHFILMDFVMVTMHGPEAARIMREELDYRGAIIGITGNALPEDIDFFVSSGANQVVTKPLSRAKLLDALHHFLPMAMAAEEEKQDQ
eukprot:gene28060-biopygen22994